MSTFPILRGDWLKIAFPLPDDLHYYSDSLIAARIYKAGIPAVAVPSCRIIHLHAHEGRGLSARTEIPISADNYPLIRDGANFYWPTLISIGDLGTIAASDARLFAAALLRAAATADELDDVPEIAG